MNIPFSNVDTTEFANMFFIQTTTYICDEVNM